MQAYLLTIEYQVVQCVPKYMHFRTICVRGLFSAKVPNSSFAKVRMGLLIEPTHKEDEDEDQENEKVDERDGEECRVEGRRVSRQHTMRMTHG